MLDNAVLEVMVRSVALAAFVETPRDSAVVPAPEPRSSAPRSSEPRSSEPCSSEPRPTKTSAGRKTVGQVLARAMARLRGALGRQPESKDCATAC